MKKRALLTEAEEVGVHAWLGPEYRKNANCPFKYIIACPYYGYRYCKKYFPGLEKTRCPCSQYGESYVKRVARKLINES